MRTFRIVLFIWLTIAFTASAVSAGEPIVTTDLLRIRSVSSIDVARDGSKAVFAVRSIATIQRPAASTQPSSSLHSSSQGPGTTVPGTHSAGSAETDPDASEPEYAYQSHLFLIDLTNPGATSRQITFGDRHDDSPKFSPDGKRILFLREGDEPARGTRHRPGRNADNDDTEDGAHSAQLWILPVDGGEARQVTAFTHGCDDSTWSPDGRRILVTAPLKFNEIEGIPPWPTERPKRTWKDATLPPNVRPRPDGTREQIRAWLEHNAERGDPDVIDRIDFQDEHTLRGPMRFEQLYLIDPDVTPAEPMAQDHARRITSGHFDHAQAAFMPDGQSVVYVSKKVSEQHPDRVLATTLWRINIDSTNDHQILTLDGWSLASPKPSRDGTVLAFTGRKMDEPAFRQNQIAIASLKGESASEPVWLTEESTFLASVNSFEWLQTQPALVFDANMRGGTPLFTVSPGLIQPAMIVHEQDGKPIGVNAFGIGGGAVVYAQSSAANPCVLKLHDARGDRTLMDLNPWIANKTISLPTGATLTRPDSTKIDYWILEPTNRENNKKYPLVLDMHGGPAAMWGPGEFTMWHELQLLCSWGFGVVYANPRGSGGYGYEFQKKNFQDWGEGPAGDVLAAVDEAILKDWVDRDRLVITGGSYAGYLTVWIIEHDNRFKAAVAQRGVYDFNTFFGEGNAWRLLPWAMGGPPYDPRFTQAIERNNDWTYVQRIKTPLLIKHGSNDLRTGVSQSEMLYRALKDMNRPVEYLRYPDAGHDLSRSGDPLQRMDRLDRIIEFLSGM